MMSQGERHVYLSDRKGGTCLKVSDDAHPKRAEPAQNQAGLVEDMQCGVAVVHQGLHLLVPDINGGDAYRYIGKGEGQQVGHDWHWTGYRNDFHRFLWSEVFSSYVILTVTHIVVQ